jgi:hypothetical protein
MEKPFKITSFKGRQEISETLRKAGCKADDDSIIMTSLFALAGFLEEHCLTTRKLLEKGELVGGKEFALRSSDLTTQGLAVLRAGFGAWEAKGYPATNLKPLEKAYKKVIEGGR